MVRPAIELITGERFTLIDMLRRYQILFTSSVTFESQGVKKLIYDVNFGLPFTRSNETEIDNITFLHDAFRFAKGSINYHLTAYSSTNSNITLYVKHIPAGIDNNTHLSLDWSDSTINREAFAHDYVLTGSTALPVTVPFYNYCNYLINHYDPTALEYADISAYSSGFLEVYLSAAEASTVLFKCERSLGDDADMYIFQGFPLVTNPLPVLQWNSETTTINTTRKTTKTLHAQGIRQDFQHTDIESSIRQLMRTTTDKRQIHAYRKILKKLTISGQSFKDFLEKVKSDASNLYQSTLIRDRKSVV